MLVVLESIFGAPHILGMTAAILLVVFLVTVFQLQMRAMLARRRTAYSRPAVKARRLLTPNELEFYGRLRRALSDTFEVIPQVAMGALLDVALPNKHPQYWNVRRLFAQKIVDFVICERKDLSVVAVVELDDRTHDPVRDAKRDAVMAAAGIRTLRWDSRNKPTVSQIRAAVLALPAPAPIPGSRA